MNLFGPSTTSKPVETLDFVVKSQSIDEKSNGSDGFGEFGEFDEGQSTPTQVEGLERKETVVAPLELNPRPNEEADTWGNFGQENQEVVSDKGWGNFGETGEE